MDIEKKIKYCENALDALRDIRIRKNGDHIVLYELMASVPEDHISKRDNMNDHMTVDELAELFGGEKSMIDNSDFVGFLVYSKDPITHLHIGLGMFPTYYKAVAMAYVDAATRYIPDCMDNEREVKMSSLYPLEGDEDFAFDIIDDKGEVNETYYILSCYKDKDRYHELGFKGLV